MCAMAENHGGDEVLAGDVERVTYFNEDNGFAVLRVAVQRHREPVTVTCRVVAVRAGERLRARGRWVEDKQFGRQFKAEDAHLSEPHSAEGLVRFLSSGMIDGVGPKLAERIVAKFGADVLRVLDKESARLEEVDGVGRKKRREIKESWERQRAVREVMVFLHAHGVSAARAQRIVKMYGEEAREVVEKSPYRLAEDIFGIGFRTADELAGRLGLGSDSAERLEAGLRHVLQRARDEGHSGLPRQRLVAVGAELLGVDEGPVAAAVDSLVARGGAVENAAGGAGPLVYLPDLLRAETRVARELHGRVAEVPLCEDGDALLERIEAKEGMELAEGQRAALQLTMRERVAVITGGPGVGKTTVLRCWLRMMQSQHLHCVLAAPTGRASRRLAEAAGGEASTLHRLLQYQPAHGFTRHRGNPLEGDCFVVDEVSMVDLPLMAAFLSAVPTEARILFVGDADQLPSVGPGSVLADMLSWEGMPVARMTEVFRQAASSRIVSAAHEIRQGRVPDLEPKAGQDCIFLPRDDAESTLATLLHLVGERLPKGLDLDALQDIQVITPMNRGVLGTATLNRELQRTLNPADPFKREIERFGQLLRRGDKVIQVRNNYDKNVFNGDIGRVAEIEEDPARVWVRFEEGKPPVEYLADELDELRLAYAITIHKSQGSEFPVVVLALDTSHFMLLRRRLLYTGLTRGRRQVVVVGRTKAWETAVRQDGDQARFGLLGARLRHSDRRS